MGGQVIQAVLKEIARDIVVPVIVAAIGAYGIIKVAEISKEEKEPEGKAE